MVIQTINIEAFISKAQKKLASTPAPGLANALKPLQSVLKNTAPPSLADLESAITSADRRFSNTYNMDAVALEQPELAHCRRQARAGITRLYDCLEEMSASASNHPVEEIEKIFVQIADEGSLACGRVALKLMRNYEQSNGNTDQPLANYMGGYFFPIAQNETCFYLVAAAARHILSFYDRHQNQCNETWPSFLEDMYSKMNECSKDISGLFEILGRVGVASIAPMATGEVFMLKLQGKDKYIYCYPNRDGNETFKSAHVAEWSCSLVKCESRNNALGNDHKFTLEVISDPETVDPAKWLLKTEITPVVASCAELNVGHKNHFYAISSSLSDAPLDPRIINWVVDRMGDGSIQFKMENIPFFHKNRMVMRENWGSLSLEDKNENSYWICESV